MDQTAEINSLVFKYQLSNMDVTGAITDIGKENTLDILKSIANFKTEASPSTVFRNKVRHKKSDFKGYKNFAPIEELTTNNPQGLRSMEMVGRCPYNDIEAVIYYVSDDMISAGIIRSDRPMPTAEYQVNRIEQMNESDMNFIEEIAYYKKDIEVVFSGTIPLTEYQQSWVDYIVGKTKVKPEPTINQNDDDVLLVNVKGKQDEIVIPF